MLFVKASAILFFVTISNSLSPYGSSSGMVSAKSILTSTEESWRFPLSLLSDNKKGVAHQEVSVHNSLSDKDGNYIELKNGHGDFNFGSKIYQSNKVYDLNGLSGMQSYRASTNMQNKVIKISNWDGNISFGSQTVQEGNVYKG